MTRSAARVSLLGCALVCVLGCNDLSEFRRDFQGGIVGADDPMCPSGRTCSFIRRGFPDGTRLRLRSFRPPSDGPPAGTLTTEGYDAFADTPLEAVAPLEHDQLSLYDFPGGGRLRNYVFIARPVAGPLAGRDVVVFLSLMEDGKVEVRVLAGSGDETRGDHFGLFLLDPV